MEIVLARNWWSLVLRGVLALILGFVAFAWPGITLGALVLLFGAYALVDGIMAVIGAWRASRAHERWGALVLEGIVGIAAAVVTVLWPAITALALVYLIATWAIVTGVLELTAAVRLRKVISGEWLMALSGIASILFGILAIIVPLAGAVGIAFMFGFYQVFFGVLLISLGFRLRSWSRTHTPRTTIPLTAH
jgi:uncharacterized membrane protein HdeD (DUF308 family)